ncbi:hypothetical protein LI328DRAFT_171976 [Trichoderma asperelloides]|nr:hypothetical protein LI328DRAFT_171976 [Trichoderma asperelloides]
MGLIRDAIGSALGANQLNNGISGGPRLPFMNNNSRNSSQRPLPTGKRPPSHNQVDADYTNRKKKTGRHYRAEHYQDDHYRSSVGSHWIDDMQRIHNDYDGQVLQFPPGSETYTGDGQVYQMQSYTQQPYVSEYYTDDRGWSRGPIFRPLALPQIAHGDGQPFLRGYSQELSHYNITMELFMQVLDSINITIIPSPENQIFQKAAKIASWFIPGAAGIGLTIGQIGIGLGVAAGQASQLSSALLNANMNVFLPNGLELCIGSSTDVDAEVGIPKGDARPYSINASPRQRIACYGDLIAPISQVLPPLQQCGRNDPIALLGRGMSDRDNQKKIEKAQKESEKGKRKEIDNLEGGLKWLIVRQASADALAYWDAHRQ